MQEPEEPTPEGEGGGEEAPSKEPSGEGGEEGQ